MIAESEGRLHLARTGALVACAVLVLAGWLQLGRAPEVRLGVDVAAQLLAPLVGLLLWGWGVYWPRRRAVRGVAQMPTITLVGLGLLADAFAQCISLFYLLVSRQTPPSPSWSDAASLSAYALFLLAILVLPGGSAVAPSRPRVLLDALVVITALVTTSWPLVLGPIALHAQQALFASLVADAYPLCDLLLLTCLLLRWSHISASAMRPALIIFTIALGSTAVVDTAVNYLSLYGSYAPGSPLDAGWLAGPLLAGLGAHALRRRLPARADRRIADPGAHGRAIAAPSLRAWQVLLPYAALPLAGLALAHCWLAAPDPRLTGGTVLGSLLLVGLVVARQVVALLDNTRLYRRLEESQRRLRTVITHAPVILFALDRDQRVTFAEGPSLAAIGLSPEAVLGRSIGDLYGADSELLAPIRRAQAGELVTYVGGVEGHTFESRIAPLDDGAGVIGVAFDVTERVDAERRLQLSEQRYRSLFEHHPDPVFSVDRAGRFTSVNVACESVSGYSVEALLQLPSFASLVVADDLERAFANFDRTLAGTPGHVDLRLMHAEGHQVPVSVTTIPIVVAGEVAGVFGIARDVTAQRQAQEALAHQALHDALTGLPNRTLLDHQLAQSAESAAIAGGSIALLLLDLDRFKEVNDTFGHHYGDLLLQQVAVRLRTAARAADMVARLGGDEFAVLLPGADREGALTAADKLGLAFASPFTVESYSLHVGASFGIAVFPEHGDDPRALLRRADVAMYVAKRAKQTCAVYAPEHDAYSPDRLKLLEDLRSALDTDALMLFYQPKIDLTAGTVCGVEALARWLHPDRGSIPPDVFIPLAEQTGLIGALTARMLDVALRQCRAWVEAGHALPVAVNLSVANLHDPTLVELIASKLRHHGVAPSLLRLELTETTVMADPRAALEVLRRLTALGVCVSIDDFGTGYSSLAYLKRLPVDELKIDRAFVQHMTANDEDIAIVSSTIGLGHSLGLQVVAEGVEDEETQQRLAQLGCDIVQGYHLARPLPPDELDRWYREYLRALPACAFPSLPAPAESGPLLFQVS